MQTINTLSDIKERQAKDTCEITKMLMTLLLKKRAAKYAAQTY
jgi:hypothetical protein